MSRLDSYPHKLTDRQIIKLLKQGKYRVDIDTGLVYGRKGQLMVPFYNDNNRTFIRIWYAPYQRALSIPRIVWIAATHQPIPKDFEIHHWDEDKSNNSFSNLFCLHKMDHNKLHGKGLIKEDLSDVPF